MADPLTTWYGLDEDWPEESLAEQLEEEDGWEDEAERLEQNG